MSLTCLYGNSFVSQLYVVAALYSLKSNRVGMKYIQICEIGINVLIGSLGCYTFIKICFLYGIDWLL